MKTQTCVTALKTIKSNLKLNYSQMGQLFNVDRNNLWHYMEGHTTYLDNWWVVNDRMKMTALLSMSEDVVGMKFARFDLVMTRPIFEGKSLYDLMVSDWQVISKSHLLELYEIDQKEHTIRQTVNPSGIRKIDGVSVADEFSMPVYF